MATLLPLRSADLFFKTPFQPLRIKKMLTLSVFRISDIASILAKECCGVVKYLTIVNRSHLDFSTVYFYSTFFRIKALKSFSK